MIGFNTEGDAKVWHNENFGRNYPQHPKRTLQSTLIDESFRYEGEDAPLEEVEMVRNIINVVEDRTEQGQLQEPFRSRIRENVGFTEARRIVNNEIEGVERTRLNRVDLNRNLIKSKISHLTTTNRAHHNNEQHSSVNFATHHNEQLSSNVLAHNQQHSAISGYQTNQLAKEVTHHQGPVVRINQHTYDSHLESNGHYHTVEPQYTTVQSNYFTPVTQVGTHTTSNNYENVGRV